MQAIAQDWSTKEIATSFECAEYLQRQIHDNYGGSSTVHIGFLYVAVGKNFGISTDRYILVIPFYDPAEHGYNYKVRNPFVYVRGFAGVSSLEYFTHLQGSWNESAELLDGNGKAALLTCSPVRMYKFIGHDLNAMEYIRSDAASIAIYDGFLEFWIHGPRNTAAVKSLPDTFDAHEFDELVRKALDKETDAVVNLANYVDKFRASCRSYSFPTFQLEIKNPMEGHLPFPVKNLRLRVDEYGGSVTPSKPDINEVHIKAATSESPRLIQLSHVWSLMINTLPLEVLTLAKSKNVFRSLKNYLC